MPTTYIKKLAKQGKGTIQALEKKWAKAKKLAAEQKHKDDYPYITGIFKKMVGASFYLRVLSRMCETAAPRNNIWFGLRNQTDVIRMAKAFGFKGTINFNADWTVVRKEGEVEIGYDPEEGFAFYGDKKVVADLLKRMFPSARIKVAGTDVYVKGIKWY